MRWALAPLWLVASTGCSQVFGLEAPVRNMPSGDGGMRDSTSDVHEDSANTGRSRLIDIVDNQVAAGPHTSFPVLVALTETWLRSTAFGGDVARDDGFDIYFTADGLTRLAHEVEKYEANTGALLAWVKIPSLASSTTFYLHYGDTTVTTSQQNRDAVWSDGYQLVLHLTDPVDASGKNSSISAINVTFLAGQVGSSARFNGGTSKISAGSADAIDNVFANGGAIDAWVYVSSYGGAGLGRIVDKGSGGGWALYVDNSNLPDSFTFTHASGNVAGVWGTAQTVVMDTWMHVAVVHDNGSAANNPVVYVNGVSVNVTEVVGPVGVTGTDGDEIFLVGNRSDDARAFDGRIDEVRLSAASRSASWFATQYRNQSNPSAFYAVSAPL